MRIIRVGVMNNFNFTEQEINHLHAFEDKGKVFVNSNSFVTIKSDFPSIITINPYLKFSEPDGDLSNVKACRIKICVGANDKVMAEENEAIRWSITKGIPVLITFQRWRKIETMMKYIKPGEKIHSYVFKNTWQRATKEAKIESKNRITSLIKSWFPKNTRQMMFFCDWNGNGCESCGNCIRLTYPEHQDGKVYSLNLSTSGDEGKCQFHCPDCFAKRCLDICRTGKPRLNEIHRNRKQKGKTENE